MAIPQPYCLRCHAMRTNHSTGICPPCRASVAGGVPIGNAPPPPPPPPSTPPPRPRRTTRRRTAAAAASYRATNQTLPPAPVALGSGPMLLQALATLEDALVAKADEGGVNQELERHFARYQKIKALALHPATGDNERKAALRQALCEAIRMVV